MGHRQPGRDDERLALARGPDQFGTEPLSKGDRGERLTPALPSDRPATAQRTVYVVLRAPLYVRIL